MQSLLVWGVIGIPLLIKTFDITRAYIGTNKLFPFLVFAVFWILILLVKQKVMNRIFYICMIFSLVWSSVIISGLGDYAFKIDKERLFFINANFSELIQVAQRDSISIPYKLRPLIFNDLYILINLIGRTISNLWIDSLLLIYGFYFTIFILIGLFKFIKLKDILPILLAAVIFSLTRDPDIGSMYILLSPIFLTLSMRFLLSKRNSYD